MLDTLVLNTMTLSSSLQLFLHQPAQPGLSGPMWGGLVFEVKYLSEVHDYCPLFVGYDFYWLWRLQIDTLKQWKGFVSFFRRQNMGNSPKFMLLVSGDIITTILWMNGMFAVTRSSGDTFSSFSYFFNFSKPFIHKLLILWKQSHMLVLKCWIAQSYCQPQSAYI